MKKIILASKSVDRSELFKRAGIPFETFVTHIDEKKYWSMFLNANNLVKELAKAKAISAKNVFLKKGIDALIIAADTIVLFDGEIIGKAKNEEEAFKILKKLGGRTHELLTGIAITEVNSSKLVVNFDITFVQFLELSDGEIRSYIKTNEWKERAGAYSVIDKASLFIKKIEGSSSNVIGMPMHKLYQILRNEFNINLLLHEGS